MRFEVLVYCKQLKNTKLFTILRTNHSKTPPKMNLSSIPSIANPSNENDIVILSKPKTVLMGKIEAFNQQFISLLVAGRVCQLPLDNVQSVVFARKHRTEEDVLSDVLFDELEGSMDLRLEAKTDNGDASVFAWLGLLLLILMVLA